MSTRAKPHCAAWTPGLCRPRGSAVSPRERDPLREAPQSTLFLSWNSDQCSSGGFAIVASAQDPERHHLML